ncbi:Type IV pilus assembly protein TapC [Saliniradius amylolyticus]|uniref:Type IV pilus assembly protein TapC n=2 Tax=Saliniradius amylolyticus TaxID=2183582 RepID=A0A2S2E0Q4_9ALTE|nr:Type IV pilus assembly protein TapC [Saliniradius amylolyticus]
MPMFKYTAYDEAGVKQHDQIQASNVEDAKRELVKQGRHVIQIKELSSRAGQSWRLSEEKVSLEDLEFLTSELSILLSSGVKIDKALAIISKNKGEGQLQRLVGEIHTSLKKGESLAVAFSKQKKVFDALYINLIRIGEATGKLPEVFDGLSRDLKFRRELRSKVIQSVTYPAVIMAVCVLCIIFVFNYIVPQMGSIFTDADDIPVYTAFLLATSDWMQNYQWFLYAAILAGAAALYISRDNPELKNKLADLSMRAPLLSSVVIQVERIRFSSAMSLMLSAGVKVDDAIGYAADSIKNPLVSKSLRAARDKVKKGASITSALTATPIYDAFYLSLLEVGEESGRMDTVFNDIASRSKVKFENWTEKLTTILEPLLILVMGGIVGSVVVTMLLSVVSVNDVGL